MTKCAVAVAVSGGGSNLQAIIDAIAEDALPVRIAVVLSDRPDCGGVQRALQHRLPVCAIPYPRRATPEQRQQWESQMLQVMQAFTPHMLLLSGFMRILSAHTLAQITVPIINQHPALLPVDGGETVQTTSGVRIPALRGAHVVADALAHKLPVTGCTVHYVVPEVDRGPVIATSEVPILEDDTVDSLHARIRRIEQPLLLTTLRRLCE